MSEEAAQEDKTEDASEKRRQDYREKGQVAKSTELSTAFILLGGTLAMWVTMKFGAGRMMDSFQQIWRRLPEGEQLIHDPNALFAAAAIPSIIALAPTFTVLMITAFFAHIMQTGPMLSWKALEPKAEKLNPLPGIKRIFFSKDAVANLVKTIVKVSVIGAVATFTLMLEGGEVTQLARQHPEDFSSYLEKISLYPLFACGAVMMAVGLVDFAWQRHRMDERMKMTKEEAKREHKQNEGDPLFKSRRAHKHRELMNMNRLVESVGEAHVIINNPTHVSVALRYRAEDGAPLVLAKGLDHRAMKIREIAKENRIPMVTNIPLARALHKSVDVGKPIPAAFYRAVAEVLAHVWKHHGRK